MDIKELSKYSFGKDAEDLKKKHKHEESLKKPTFFQKNISSILDFIVVFVIRFIASAVLGIIWYNLRLKEIFEKANFHQTKAFETLIKLGVFYDFAVFATIVIFTGGIYYIVFYSSKLSATLGCIVCDVKLVDKKTGGRISLFRSFIRYILCLMPLFFMMIVAIKYYQRSIDLTFVILTFASVVWYDLWMIFRIEGGVPDLITRTVLISTKARKPRRFKIF